MTDRVLALGRALVGWGWDAVTIHPDRLVAEIQDTSRVSITVEGFANEELHVEMRAGQRTLEVTVQTDDTSGINSLILLITQAAMADDAIAVLSSALPPS